MNRLPILIGLLVASFSSSGFSADPAAPAGMVPHVKIPDGWSQAIEITSPPMKLNPSPATGLPSGQVMRPFELRIWVHERLSEEAHTVRVRKNAEIRKQLPNGKVVPPEFRDLERQILPEADFYDEHAAYEIEFPSWLPASEEDRQAILKIYDQLRAHWTAYPSSRHGESDYFARLLKAGYVPAVK